jgi:hypothetical protein
MNDFLKSLMLILQPLPPIILKMGTTQQRSLLTLHVDKIQYSTSVKTTGTYMGISY